MDVGFQAMKYRTFLAEIGEEEVLIINVKE